MKHIVSLSGGTASAVAADRVIERYGKENTTLWFSDTSWEDQDLHRFLADCYARWSMTPVVYKDGRTPLQVAEDVKLIPNQRRAPCSRVLKQEPFFRYLKTEVDKPVTVHLGLDWMETHRMDAPKKRYEALASVTVDFPLTWPPTVQPYQVVESWGIKPPRLYDMGFPHNNCGGRCIRQGLKEWQRLKATFPDRFDQVRDWEKEQRAIGDARSGYAIARDQRGGKVTPLPLDELERRGFTTRESKPNQEDMFGCFCDY